MKFCHFLIFANWDQLIFTHGEINRNNDCMLLSYHYDFQSECTLYSLPDVCPVWLNG